MITKRQEIGVDEAETSGATASECFPEHAQDPPKRKRKFDFLFRKKWLENMPFPLKLKYTTRRNDITTEPTTRQWAMIVMKLRDPCA